MAGLGPAIHVLATPRKTWMRGTSPRMTGVKRAELILNSDAMSFPRPHALLLAIGVAVLALASQKAGAETYPSRPVHLVVAFVPGGATDTLARQISNDLKETLGQPVVVENRPGANGYLAWNHVAAAEPDGYTLLLAENALAISQALHKKATSSFDPLTQYDPIAGIATSPSALIVANNIPVRSVAELVAYSRTVPQKMNYASAGVGSVSHLNFEVFKDAVGMEAIHIPYKGGGQAIADVVAGHVPMTITSVQAIEEPGRGRPHQGLGGDRRDALSCDARRSDHAGGGREGRGRGAAFLVRSVWPQGPAGRRQGEARASALNRHKRSACA